MDSHEQPEHERADAFISIRLHEEDKALVAEAAKREGLQLSSFFIFLLVKCKILPENRLLRIKRKPVENYKALHGLLGLINKLGGLCKQIARFQPDAEGLEETRESLIHAAAAIADCLNGKEPADSLNLSLIKPILTNQGYILNELVKYLNAGKYCISGLTEILDLIRSKAITITRALNGGTESEALTDMAMEEMRERMQKPAQTDTDTEEA